MIRETSFKASSAGSSSFGFSRYVTNIQLLAALNVKNNTMIISVFRDGADVTKQLVLTDMGLCKQNFTYPTNSSILALNSNNGNVAVNLGGVYFDELLLSYKTDEAYGNSITAYQLGLCNGLAITKGNPIPNPNPPYPPPAPTPSPLLVTSTTLPGILTNVIIGGTSITFTATGGTPNQGDVTWTLVTTNTTNSQTITASGTGYTCTAILAEAFTGKAVATFTANYTSHGSTATTTGSQTVNIAMNDDGIDKIRARLSGSTATYDAAAQNTWVQVTTTEYGDIYKYVQESIRYGDVNNVVSTTQCNDDCKLDICMTYNSNNIEQTTGDFEYQTSILKDIFVYGFSFRTANSNTIQALEANKMSISRNAFERNEYPIGGETRTFFPHTNLNSSTTYCYILKKTNAKFLRNARLALSIDVQNVISTTDWGAVTQTGNYAYYYWKSGDNGKRYYPPKAHSHNVQIIGTPTKQW